MASRNSKIIAWSVHILTASGILAGFMAMVATDNGEWDNAFLWLLVCLLIDGIDGSLAKKFNISQIIPSVDGKGIDTVVDFTCYAIVPGFFFYKADMAQGLWMPVCVIFILLSSTFYYGKKEMVVDKEYFAGFPVLWNIAVFYLFFVFGNIPWLNVFSVVFFSILHFIPLKFPYPSKSINFIASHIIMAIAGSVSAAGLLICYPEEGNIFKIVLVGVAGYFFFFVIYNSIRGK